MTLTLNQVISRLKTLALSHKQLNHFFFGDIVNWLHSGDVSYPASFCELVKATTNKTDKTTVFDFRVWFADLADVATESQTNEIEVQSDLTSIAQDYIAMLGFTEYQSDWDILPTFSMQYFTEKFEDVVIAVAVDISIGVRFDSNRCQVPASNVSFENQINPDMAVVQNYIYTGFGTEGNTIVIPSLSSKIVLMLFKGDKSLTPTNEVPGVNEYKKTGDLFTFGNDIEKDQVLQILNKGV
jgi:hypothetical protein